MPMTRSEIMAKARAARAANGRKAPVEPPEDSAPAPRIARETVRQPVRRSPRVAAPSPSESAPAPRINRATANLSYEVGENGRIIAHMNGEMFTRKRVGHQDPLQFAAAEIPPGMSYQWIAVSVHNNNDLVPLHTAQWMENGWRPVPSERHPGRFMSADKKGAIVRDGLMLVERPALLTKEAMEEDLGIAKRQLTERNDQFNPPLPGARQHPGAKMRARRSIESMPSDIAPPAYELGE